MWAIEMKATERCFDLVHLESRDFKSVDKIPMCDFQMEVTELTDVVLKF